MLRERFGYSILHNVSKYEVVHVKCGADAVILDGGG
jgi:hypothetical protein